MDRYELTSLLLKSKYDFLANVKELGMNIIFLTLGGSHAYGTNVEGSDVDIRGCTLDRPENLIGLVQLQHVNPFEVFEDKETDTVIYGFTKLMELLIKCNPNTIELLGGKEDHYICVSPIDQKLIDNADMFLSKRAIGSFGGYANTQLRRMTNAVARDAYGQAEKERHIMDSIIHQMDHFRDTYTNFSEGSIKLNIHDSVKADIDKEIFMDIDLKNYPMRDFVGIWSEMNNVAKMYSKINHRNKKKDEIHLDKHAMHLVRLFLMCLDILEQKKIITYREKDLSLLMSIRNGKFRKADNTYDEAFFDLISELEAKLKYAAEHTELPEDPDFERIAAFMFDTHKVIITR